MVIAKEMPRTESFQAPKFCLQVAYFPTMGASTAFELLWKSPP